MPGAKKTPAKSTATAKKTAKATKPVEATSSAPPVVEEPLVVVEEHVEEVVITKSVVDEAPVVEEPKKPAKKTTPAKKTEVVVEEPAKKVAAKASPPAKASASVASPKVVTPPPAKTSPSKVTVTSPKSKPVEEEEDEGLPVCTDDVCEVQPEEEEEEEEDEEVESEHEPVYIEDRTASVPITSITSPRHIAREARTSQANRVMSPRTGDARSPRRTIDARKVKAPSSRYEDLRPDDLIYNEDDIATVTFTHYENVRASDVITFLVARERCPHVFRAGGTITRENDENTDEVTPVQYSRDIDEAFEIFECIQGILAFMPISDMDFGDDDETVHRLGSNSDYVYIAPVLSSGDSGGAIRFVDDLVVWGAITLEDYDKLKTRPTYRQDIKRMDMTDVNDIFSHGVDEEEEYEEQEEEEYEEAEE